MKRNRRTAAWLALVLGTVAFPSMAAARETGSDVVESAENAEAADPAAMQWQPGAQLTSWVIASGDNHDMPFMVIDKTAAQLFVHDADGKLLGVTPALIGTTAGDESYPGVGDRELSNIKLEERTTPAGRFVAKFGVATGGKRVLWVDYETAISLHPVVTAKKKERRLQRLKSPTPEDNRITFGCINISPTFYTKVVRPLFAKTSGVVYILPETKPLNEVFLAFKAQRQSSATAQASR